MTLAHVFIIGGERKSFSIVLALWLQANYGKDEKPAVEVVKSVYKDLELKKLFEAYEQESHAELTSMINEQTMLPKEVFTGLLNKIYKRKK